MLAYEARIKRHPGTILEPALNVSAPIPNGAAELDEWKLARAAAAITNRILREPYQFREVRSRQQVAFVRPHDYSPK